MMKKCASGEQQRNDKQKTHRNRQELNELQNVQKSTNFLQNFFL